MSKVLERMVANRIGWYLEHNKLLNSIQAGFRKNHSTVDHPMRLKTEIENALKSGNITVGVFLDFSRAFDRVWIDSLLMKTMALGIEGHCLKYIENFLNGRTAQVVLKGDRSDIYSSDNGTPQECVLSPLLFLIFINDFPALSPHSSSALFADDSSIWRSGSNIHQITFHLQQDLHKIEKWCNDWGFKINTAKSYIVIFTKKKNITTELIINKKPIAVKKNGHLPGVHLRFQAYMGTSHWKYSCSMQKKT